MQCANYLQTKYEIEKIDGKNKKIQVLYNGIELEKFRNVDEEKQRKKIISYK